MGGATRRLLLLGVLAIGLGLIALSLVDPHFLRSLGDQLSTDGDASTLESSTVLQMQTRLVVAGGALLLLTLLLTRRWARGHERLQELFGGTPGFARRGARRVKRFVLDEPLHAGALVLLTAASGVLCLLVLGKPITCDEAYTTMYFAEDSPLGILCNYISPNNHILHTLLVHASYALLGEGPAPLRLPALFAGLATVPACYLAVRVHFGRAAALLAAALVATHPYLIDVHTNARGYPFLELFTLLLIALVPRLVRMRAVHAWTVFVLLSALGFFAVPVMLFPFAAIVSWLALEGWITLRGRRRRAFLARLGRATLGSLLVAVLLYLPSIVVHGTGVTFAREFVRPRVPGDLASIWEHLVAQTAWMWDLWGGALPRVVLPALGLLALASLVLGRERGTARRLLACSTLVPLVIVLGMSKVPPARCVTFLLFVFLSLGAVGFTALARALGASQRTVSAAVLGLVLGIVALDASATWSHRDQQFRMKWFVGYFDAPAAAAYLAEHMTPRERVAGIREERPPLHYYYRRETGRDFLTFYPFDETSRANIRVNPDMDADDTPETVDAVWLIDTGNGRLPLLKDVIRRDGFRFDGTIVPLAHSRLLRYSWPEATLVGKE